MFRLPMLSLLVLIFFSLVLSYMKMENKIYYKKSRAMFKLKADRFVFPFVWLSGSPFAFITVLFEFSPCRLTLCAFSPCFHARLGVDFPFPFLELSFARIQIFFSWFSFLISRSRCSFSSFPFRLLLLIECVFLSLFFLFLPLSFFLLHFSFLFFLQ